MAKEYIERKKLSNACYEIYEETVRAWQSMSASEVKELMHRFEKAIQTAPAADVVEVVRCKDCKYSADKTDGGNYLCNRKMLGLVRPNDFCSFGERRDNE